MKLGFDLDGVLADWNTLFIERIIELTGKDLFPPRPFDIPTWWYPQHYGYSDDETKRAFLAIQADPAATIGMPAYPWTEAVLTRLSRWAGNGSHDIYFITHRGGAKAKAATEGWLLLHGFYTANPTVLLTSQKGLACKTLGLDLYVDDKRENCDDVHFNSDTRVFLFDQPWNRDGKTDYYTRITSLEQMLTGVTPQ